MRTETLTAEWNVLRRYTIELRRRDGTWQTCTREVCHRGDSIALLLYCPARRTILLTQQFRLPLFVGGDAQGLSLEVVGGIVTDGDAPWAVAQREAEEEAGVRIGRPVKLMVTHMSPSVLAERVHLFAAVFEPTQRVSEGGGIRSEGEDILVHEVQLDDALHMIALGQITDGRTILLLYHAKVHNLMAEGDL